jgi:hypothetical protein
MIKALRACVFLAFIVSPVAAQEIPVDMHTGTPTIQIPIWTISDHDLADAVSLVYNADGVKLAESDGDYGLGWQLQAGGSISREVRGLPDDHLGTGSDTRIGWLHLTSQIHDQLANFGSGVDLSVGTCNDETASYNILQGYNYAIDTEPDIFHYTVGGISGSFVFDRYSAIRLMPYRDVKIEYQIDAETNKILWFKVTSNMGIVHTFDVTDTTFKQFMRFTGFVKVNHKEYEQYKDGITFNAAWHLKKTESPTGAILTYDYTSVSKENTITSRFGVRNLSGGLVSDILYNITENRSVNELHSITSSTMESVEFSPRQYSTELGFYKLITIQDGKRTVANKTVRQFTLKFIDIYLPNQSQSKKFLRTIQEQGGSQRLPPHEFTYINVDLDAKATSLPEVKTNQKDFWGYFNGKNNGHLYPKLYVYPSYPLAERFRLYPIPNHAGPEYILGGADRTPDKDLMQVGTLKTINYPTGGTTTLHYEPHEYYDDLTEQNYIGGGLRIKSIVYFDGVNGQNKIVKNFEYKQTDGRSSGKLLIRPVFAIPALDYEKPDAYNEGSRIRKTYSQLTAEYSAAPQAVWDHLIIRSGEDLNQSSESGIKYARVKVTRPGSGSAEFEYDVPALYGNTTSGTWNATQNKFARSSGCSGMALVNEGGAWGYPYSPNPNFDFERGFLKKKIERDQQGNKVRETTYTPQYIYGAGSAPFTVWGVAYEHYANSANDIYFFGQYYLLTDVEKTIAQETVVTYNVQDTSKTFTESTEFIYSAPAHRLLTQTKFTAADGTVVSTKTKYPLDYTIPTTAIDAQLQAIKTLQESNRNGIAIEVRTEQTKPGKATKVISSSVTKFSDFGIPGKVFPHQALVLRAGDGLTDFIPSDKEQQGSAFYFKHDNRYEVVNTYLKFSDYQLPVNTVGKDRVVHSTHWGHKNTLPVVEASYAHDDEYVFSNFETDDEGHRTGHEFTIGADVAYGFGRGDKAVHYSTRLSAAVKKANATNYRISFWLKKASSPVDFRLQLMDTSQSTVYYDQTFSVNPSGSEFEYFEKLIPVDNVPSTFSVILQGVYSGASPATAYTLLPLLDEVAFYPEHADLTIYTYNNYYNLSALTAASGDCAYYEYDGLNRLTTVYDRDKNIIKKNTITVDGISNTAPPVFEAGISFRAQERSYNELSGLLTDVPYLFFQNSFLVNNINDDHWVIYEWDFGDGAGFQSLGPEPIHTFTQHGTYQVRLRKTHPVYGQVMATRELTVVAKVLAVYGCAKGPKVFGVSEYEVITSSLCDQITEVPPPHSTLFKITGFSPNIEPITQPPYWSYYDPRYEQWRPLDVLGQSAALNWTPLLSLFDRTFEPGSSYTVTVKCEISTTIGRTVTYTDTITFIYR